jgi:hypothetical protein
MCRYILVALLIAIAAGSTQAAPAATDGGDNPVPRRAGNVEQRLRIVDKRITLLERSANRFERWLKCISWVRVNEVGDRDHRFGFSYDDVDGTGPDKRPALAIDRTKKRYSDYLFLKFARRAGCRSQATVPGGTADPAFHHATATSRGRHAQSLQAKKPSLRARLRSLARRAERVDRISEIFDQWESCLSWVPVTEYGDPEGKFGYLFEGGASTGTNYKPAIAVDISEWDDPDYEFLAFVGKDRPFGERECNSEPGESDD